MQDRGAEHSYLTLILIHRNQTLFESCLGSAQGANGIEYYMQEDSANLCISENTTVHGSSAFVMWGNVNMGAEQIHMETKLHRRAAARHILLPVSPTQYSLHKFTGDISFPVRIPFVLPHGVCDQICFALAPESVSIVSEITVMTFSRLKLKLDTCSLN